MSIRSGVNAARLVAALSSLSYSNPRTMLVGASYQVKQVFVPYVFIG